jgi:hypothetical protein
MDPPKLPEANQGVAALMILEVRVLVTHQAMTNERT